MVIKNLMKTNFVLNSILNELLEQNLSSNPDSTTEANRKNEDGVTLLVGIPGNCGIECPSYRSGDCKCLRKVKSQQINFHYDLTQQNIKFDF